MDILYDTNGNIVNTDNSNNIFSNLTIDSVIFEQLKDSIYTDYIVKDNQLVKRSEPLVQKIINSYSVSPY